MILRRLSTDLRQQDWVTVLVETLIVVFGVFIGLQVNNWNAVRVEQVEQVALLQRLEADFSVSAPRAERASERLHEISGQTGQLIEFLRSINTPPDTDDILLIVNAPSLLSSIPPVSSTYLEMLSTGGLSRIENEDLRNALVRYGETNGRFQLMYSKAMDRIASTEGTESIFSSMEFDTHWDLPEGQSPVLSFDWEKLQAAEAQIYGVYIFQKSLSQLANEQHEQVQTILSLLKAELE